MLGGLLACAPVAARPAPPDNPTEIQRKAAAREKVAVAKKTAALKKASSHKTKKATTKMRRAMLVLLGFEESKHVTSPVKRDWQLHLHQKYLKMMARQESRAHRRRCQRRIN